MLACVVWVGGAGVKVEVGDENVKGEGDLSIKGWGLEV